MDKLYTYLNVRSRELKVSKVEVFNIRLKRVSTKHSILYFS